MLCHSTIKLKLKNSPRIDRSEEKYGGIERVNHIIGDTKIRNNFWSTIVLLIF